MLFIVPTPIGNLDDMTYRAVKTLSEVDYILAEDTRTSKPLLQHYGIQTPLRAHHAHNEHQAVMQVVNDLKNGKKVALISDAGTPGISDPGFLVVRACVEAGLELTCLPGATAFVPALVASGLPCDRFYFEGFLPHKKGRQTRLQVISVMENTVVLYESPHRLLKCLEQLQEFCGADRKVVVCREISKMYEEKARGTVEEVLKYYTINPSKIRGEIVIIIAGMEVVKKKKKYGNDDDEEAED
jgi:16S rRNA (cytidine1402-2'-O)-methyltransferase